jgi:hypothetical protein
VGYDVDSFLERFIRSAFPNEQVRNSLGIVQYFTNDPSRQEWDAFAVHSASEKAPACPLFNACAPPHHKFPVRIKAKIFIFIRSFFEKPGFSLKNRCNSKIPLDGFVGLLGTSANVYRTRFE